MHHNFMVRGAITVLLFGLNLPTGEASSIRNDSGENARHTATRSQILGAVSKILYNCQDGYTRKAYLDFAKLLLHQAMATSADSDVDLSTVAPVPTGNISKKALHEFSLRQQFLAKLLETIKALENGTTNARDEE